MQKITPFLWFNDNADAEKSQPVMNPMLQMVKIDIVRLKQAYEEA